MTIKRETSLDDKTLCIAAMSKIINSIVKCSILDRVLPDIEKIPPTSRSTSHEDSKLPSTSRSKVPSTKRRKKRVFPIRRSKCLGKSGGETRVGVLLPGDDDDDSSMDLYEMGVQDAIDAYWDQIDADMADDDGEEDDVDLFDLNGDEVFEMEDVVNDSLEYRSDVGSDDEEESDFDNSVDDEEYAGGETEL